MLSISPNTVHVYCIIYGQYIMKKNDSPLQKHIHKENTINSLETLRYILCTMLAYSIKSNMQHVKYNI